MEAATSMARFRQMLSGETISVERSFLLFLLICAILSAIRAILTEAWILKHVSMRACHVWWVGADGCTLQLL